MANTQEVVQGQAGGETLFATRGPKYMAKIGSKGGKAVVKRYGKNYMTLIGALGNNAQHENMSKTKQLNVERAARRIVREKS